MPSVTQPTHIVDVAIGIVVDKMSPSASSTDPNNAAHRLPDASKPVLRILITRRKAEQVLGGYWELPGGKVEPDESPSEAAIRELREEVGIEVRTIDTLAPTDHRYDHAHVRLIPFICELISGTPTPLHVDELRWVTPDRLADYTFPQASLPVIASLLRWLDNNRS